MPTDDAPPWRSTIWQAWLGHGNNPLPGVLAAAHATVVLRAGGGMRVRLLRDADIARLVPRVVAHPAYAYLPPVHKSDYVRAAVLHEHGGIWLDTDAFIMAGSLAEVVRTCADDDGVTMPHQAVIGPLSPNTTFTRLWLSSVEDVLWRNLDKLAHPGGPKPLYSGADCGWTREQCLPFVRHFRWEFLLGDVWRNLSQRIGSTSARYSSMGCDAGSCIRCCTSHWTDSVACSGRERVDSAPPPSRPSTWLVKRRPPNCRVRRFNRNGTLSRPAADVHVMLSLSSSIPKAIKDLPSSTFLRGTSVLSQRARELLGIKASANTLAAITRKNGCVRNTSQLNQRFGNRSAYLERLVLPGWPAAE